MAYAFWGSAAGFNITCTAKEYVVDEKVGAVRSYMKRAS